MTTSVTGAGHGAANKPRASEIAAAFTGPAVYFVGAVDSQTSIPPSSPPTGNNHVVLPEPLPGPTDNYAIFVTTSDGGGYAYVTDVQDDDNGNLISFDFITQAPGTAWFMVVKKGFRRP